MIFLIHELWLANFRLNCMRNLSIATSFGIEFAYYFKVSSFKIYFSNFYSVLVNNLTFWKILDSKNWLLDLFYELSAECLQINKEKNLEKKHKSRTTRYPEFDKYKL